MSVYFRRMTVLLAACGLLLATAACRENEQGRILVYKKGTYLGPEDAARDDTNSEALRGRVNHQRGP